MKAAIVRAVGQLPVYGDFSDPVPTEGEHRIKVSAAAISQVTRSRASGTHYSSSGGFPFVVGIDGVGRLDDGRRVYFALPRAPYGGMAERTVVPVRQCLSLPDELDDVTAAAIANPGVSSWAALTERARLQPGQTVLINGATGTSGRLAVQIARHLGAGKVIATGRSAAGLEAVAGLGADATISLLQDGAALDRNLEQLFADRVDVVIDYLWGERAERILMAGARAGEDAAPIRYVQVGSASGTHIRLPSAVLRSSAIELMGSGIGSIAIERLIGAIGALLQATPLAGFKIGTDAVPLSEVETAWSRPDAIRRTVVTMVGPR